ncbi:septum formation inhibitor Maf [Candidatus Peregrinibacteria bacterium]|nr:MAG: septum formation inhibitor Maf [Candidatus Peregrinibacteria bacterium]
MLNLKYPLILASQSPRRKELLNLINLSFEVDIPHEFEEFTAAQIPDPQELVKANAAGKVQEVRTRHPAAVILGVDTVVALDGQILGKPANPEEAVKMLQKLQGKTHTVWTGVQLLDTTTGKKLSFEEQTEVDFLPMSDEVIRAYVKTGEPMDKAGAYAIQGLGSVHIRGIRGDFFTVVGLPLAKVYAALRELQI